MAELRDHPAAKPRGLVLQRCGSHAKTRIAPGASSALGSICIFPEMSK